MSVDLEEKIQQFKTMADADPQNELGHFSLGQAYLEGRRPTEAMSCFQRVVELNPSYSKAYHLLAEAQLQLEDEEGAKATLRRGVEVAGERGDIVPLKSMTKLLRKLGEDVPEVEAAGPEPAVAVVPGDGSFTCARCGRPDGRMAERPFKGELGERIYREICATCWGEWIPMGTKVINELGLALADPRAQQLYDQYMKEFLMLE